MKTGYNCNECGAKFKHDISLISVFYRHCRDVHRFSVFGLTFQDLIEIGLLIEVDKKVGC